MKAIWNDTIIAESSDTIILEGNHYFPLESIKKEFFKESAHTSECHWKGTASYYDIEVNGSANRNAAWYYKEPLSAASQIAGHVAFWEGVQVVD